MKFGRCESCGSFNDPLPQQVEPNMLNLAIQKEIIKSKANKLNQIEDPPESHYNFFAEATVIKSPVSIGHSLVSKSIKPKFNRLICFNRQIKQQQSPHPSISPLDRNTKQQSLSSLIL